MKKNLITICLCLFFATGFSQSGDTLKYLITYKLKYQPDSTDTNSKNSEITWLFLGDNTALYLSKPLAIRDSLPKPGLADLSSERGAAYRAKTKTDLDFKILKNRKSQILYYTTQILDDQLFYTQPIPEFRWNIQEESKMISDYKVQKATTTFAGRNFIAWFTPEIPITEGPYKFGGLPGLILSLEDTQGHYVFNFKSFEKLKRPVKLQIPPENHRVVSKEELLDLKKRYEENPVAYINNYVGEGGKKVRVQLKNENMKDYIKKRKIELAKKNNPIELK